MPSFLSLKKVQKGKTKCRHKNSIFSVPNFYRKKYKSRKNKRKLYRSIVETAHKILFIPYLSYDENVPYFYKIGYLNP